MILDTRATLIDEIIDLHDRFMGSLSSKAKRHHADRFQESGKAINDKVRLYSRIGRALLKAKQSGSDPFAAIEAILPWEGFSESVNEVEKLAQSEDFDYLALVGDGFRQLRRYTPALLEALSMKAAPAARDVLAAVAVLKGMNERQGRKVPDDAPTSFVRKRWESLVRTPDGPDRRHYELCILSELKNSLRSGDIWLQGSRQFKDFEEYLLPPPRFAVQRDQRELGLAVETDCERYLESRLSVLREQLATVEWLAAANELPEAAIDRTHMVTARYPALLAAHDSGAPSPAGIDCAIAASVEGYAFPTNLDRDPPIGGPAPKTQTRLTREAVAAEMTVADFEALLREHAERRCA